MEDDMWDLAIKANDDASNCNIGKDPCVEGTKFGMTLVTVSPDDTAKIRDAVSTVILPAWRDVCTNVDPNCTKIWNETIGDCDRLRNQVTGCGPSGRRPYAAAVQPIRSQMRSNRLARFIAVAGGYWLMLIAVATCIEVISRKVFSFSLLGVDEVGGYTLAVLAASGVFLRAG